MSNFKGEINENTIKTWKKEELPQIIFGLPESKQLYTITVVSNYFNENKENKKKDEEDINSFKYILKLLLSEYAKEIGFESSDEEVKKLFEWHNRSIHFVKTFIETVEGKWKEQKEEFEKNKPKKVCGPVANVIKTIGQFFPIYSPAITLFSIALNKIGDQIFHINNHRELLKKLELLYQNSREALVKCAVDILYSYEGHLVKAVNTSDVTKIAKIAADRVLEYCPKYEEDLNTNECYKELLKTLISAKGKGVKATLVEDDGVKAEIRFKKSLEELNVKLKIDDIFAKAPVYFSGKVYQRVKKQHGLEFDKWKISRWEYGHRRKFNCVKVETLHENESSFSDNCINYCFNKNLTCNYLWQVNLEDENSFLSLCKKYSRCVKNSIDILKEDIDLLKDMLMDTEEGIKKLMQDLSDHMRQKIEEKIEEKAERIEDKIEEKAEIIENKIENGFRNQAMELLKVAADLSEIKNFMTNTKEKETQELPQLDNLNINERPSQPERDLAMPIEASDTTKPENLVRGNILEKLITVQNPDAQLKIDMLLNSPLKEYRQGRGELEDLLNIEDTMDYICDEFDFSERTRNDIDLTIAGGGNPAKVFLEDFKSKHGEKSSESFKKVLETFKIIWPKSESTVNKDDTLRLVSQLSNNCISELSVQLTRARESVWKDIAAEYEYTMVEIEKIKRHQKRPNNYSRAEAFFRFIDQEKPDYSVKEFMVLLLRLKINNAYDHMKKTIINWAELSVGIN